MRIIILYCLIVSSSVHGVLAETADDKTDSFAKEKKKREVAVALNYCRASFHRIRKYPSREVMEQERQKILNNLILNGISDPEIIRLYTEVLDEIGQLQLTDKEEDLFHNKFHRAVRKELAFDALSIGLDIATAQYLGAVRSGANSWWDYRSHSWTRDVELLKLEKAEVNSIVKKSSTFLDTFWKLAQKNDIPDHWLVRPTDLDDLESAMTEKDPEVRLRILNRMQPFMQCYPPYWYYLGRTQQSLGQLFASLKTYEQLAVLGDGHFRRDEMMTSALANQAVIQAYLGQPHAHQTASQSLTYSTTVWEANLSCAEILQSAGKLAEAEDAILRNLDVGLEHERSSISLLSFYDRTDNITKLAKYIADPEYVKHIPPPALIRFASKLSEDQIPNHLWTKLATTIQVKPQLNFGKDDLVLSSHPDWDLSKCRITLQLSDGQPIEGVLVSQSQTQKVHFHDVGELGSLFTGPSQTPEIHIHMKYGQQKSLKLHFANGQVDYHSRVSSSSQQLNQGYQLTTAEWGDHRIAIQQPVIKSAQLDRDSPNQHYQEMSSQLPSEPLRNQDSVEQR